MPKVTFLKDDVGSEDGNTVINFRVGQTASISESLCRQFLLRKSVVVIEEPEVKQQDLELKKIESAPENKMQEPVKANKRGILSRKK